jgi:hypothetical protein
VHVGVWRPSSTTSLQQQLSTCSLHSMLLSMVVVGVSTTACIRSVSRSVHILRMPAIGHIRAICSARLVAVMAMLDVLKYIVR